MAFGDNSAARARKAQLIAEQAEGMKTVQAYDEALYHVYKDLPPGTGWCVKRVGTYAVAKWYLATEEAALGAVNRHARQFALGRNADENGRTSKALRRLK